MMKKYKYLLWDIDGTVLDFLAAEKAAIRMLFEKYNFGLCSDEMLSRYSKISKKYWQALERNEMTKSEILVGRFKEFFAGEGINVELAEAFNSDYQLALGDTIVFCDDAKNILLKEKEKFVLVAVTNGTKVAQTKKLKNSGLDKIFDYIFISEDIGFEKPNKEFFDVVIKSVKIVDLSEVLIIGDSLTSDILGGKNIGVDTCWYNPMEKENMSNVNPTFCIKNLHELGQIIEGV